MTKDIANVERLTDRQRNFVVAYVANGGNAARAAREAGYSKESARRIAHDLLNKPHVAVAVQVESIKEFARLAPKALRVLHNVLNEDPPKKGDRLSATRLATADVKARTAVQVFRDGRGLSEKVLARKPLNEMTLAELDELIDQMDKRRGVVDVTPTAKSVDPENETD